MAKKVLESLKQVDREAVPELVSHCEEMLELARAGRLRGLVQIAAVEGEGSTQFDWLPTETNERFEYVGRLDMIKLTILSEIMGEAA